MEDMAVAMANGDVSAIDLKGTAIQLGKALNDPITGLTALRKVGVTFTQSQEDLIKKFMETNDLAGAQAVILKELEGEFGGAAEAAGDTFQGQISKLENAFGELAETVGSELLPRLTEASETLNLLLTWDARIGDALEQHNQELIRTSASYEEYLEKRTADLVTAGKLSEATRTELLTLTAEQKAIDEATAKFGELTEAKLDELVATGKLTEDEAGLLWEQMQNTAYREKRIAAINQVTKAEFEEAHATEVNLAAKKKLMTALEKAGPYMSDYIDQWSKVNDVETIAADKARDLEEAQTALENAMSNLQSYIAGPLGAEMESYAEALDEINGKQSDLQTEIEETQAKIEALEGKKYLTPAQKEELEDLKEKLGDLQTEYQDNITEIQNMASEHELATKKILFDIAQQQLAMSGLSYEEQLKALEEMATELGLVDTATQGATVALQALVAATTTENADNLGNAMAYIAQAALDGKISVEELNKALDILNGKTVYTTVVTTYATAGATNQGTQTAAGNRQEYATGVENFVVPAGYPDDTYLVGLTSGETVSVTPTGMAGTSEGGVTITIEAGAIMVVGTADPEATAEEVMRRLGDETNAVLAAARAKGMR
jgi:hypothetical protein